MILPENPVAPKPAKQPISVLVLLHDDIGNVLLLERADRKGFWQSVTGSLEMGETPFQAALREVAEETGLILQPEHIHDWQHHIVYEIFPHWRHRYAVGVTHNTEHWFSVQLPRACTIKLAPDEHTAQKWLSAAQAAEKVFSPSNRDIILQWHQTHFA
ncbi:MAG: dihydroneopterin triphosphate diphosphatase [Alysiella sp.]|uniref:dihydroneopterin triphosphate diphosphatase n=1 Tax=Alysiella sp. TaxID=1872483 RepID=UPI0026DA7C06|nr:dihydroneopterin triphosphate diphosphatase [Alysiella sp.]MDO4433484.1 dihydroneopterin triphosphate diphosphatase [Alysiella sp.]